MAAMVMALLSGALFGAGLLVSGMTDTFKVQGFLDIAGAWDPTLAFVMGGAMLPMALAWRIAAARQRSFLGLPLPARPRTEIDRQLLTGSALFGAGWALVGFCPGPAIASLSFGGTGGALFLFAMVAGMLVAAALRRTQFPSRKRSHPLDIRALTPAYAVSPQIDIEDLPAIKAAGYTTVIDNRPDGEIPPHLHTAAMRAAAEAIGLTFVVNPIIGGALTMDNVTAQGAAIASATGPVLAYCASGNRSSVVWALSQAGKMPTDQLISTPARFGYQLEHLRPQIDAMAAKG
jgi:uncharacterized protein (TIGR01244 family)